MASKPSIYTLMGLSPDADKVAIKSAYRSLALRLHPDVYKHLGHADDNPWTHVQLSYAILTDRERRLVYDDIVIRGGATRLADPVRFERWFGSSLHVNYETGTVTKGDQFFQQLGAVEMRLLRNRHLLGWGLATAPAVAYAARSWYVWRPCEAGEYADSAPARASRAAFFGGLLGGVSVSAGHFAQNGPAGSARAAAVAGLYAAVSASAGALSIGPLFKAAGCEPELSDQLFVRMLHANSATTCQAVGALFGAAHVLQTAPKPATAHWRVSLASLAGAAVGTLCDRLVRRATGPRESAPAALATSLGDLPSAVAVSSASG